jgi:chemotaxis signal transduction protein
MGDIQAVLLPVGADLYAVPIGWIKEVLVAPTLTPLVTAPSVVLGLFNLRGQIVPLIDTAALLCGTSGAPAFALVLQSPDGLVGLAATAIPKRVVLKSPLGPSEQPGTVGTYELQRQAVVLLDPAVLLAPERLGGQTGQVGPVLSGVA